METEIFKTAVYEGVEYEGYEVSNLGRVKSLNYNHTGKAEVMKPGTDKDGYFQVVLSKNGETKTCKVHRLVAFAFLPNPDGKPEINHKIEGDEGKTLNIVILNEDGSVDEKRTTIEWCTREENNNYGTRNERVSKAKINGKMSKKVIQLSLTGELIREWESVNECGRNGFNKGHVSACCRGEEKSHKKFRWQYK